MRSLRRSAGFESAAGRTVPGAQPACCCRPFWDRAWALPSGASGWAPARCAMACCPVVRAHGPRGARVSDGHRYVDFSIRYLAQQFDALGASRKEWK